MSEATSKTVASLNEKHSTYAYSLKTPLTHVLVSTIWIQTPRITHWGITSLCRAIISVKPLPFVTFHIHIHTFMHTHSHIYWDITTSLTHQTFFDILASCRFWSGILLSAFYIFSLFDWSYERSKFKIPDLARHLTNICRLNSMRQNKWRKKPV